MSIKVHRGSSVPITWRFKNADGSLFDLTGKTFTLSIADLESERIILRKRSGDADGLSVDVPGAMVTWTPTEEESRLIPKQPSLLAPPVDTAAYELEETTEKRIWASGGIKGIGGLNEDAP